MMKYLKPTVITLFICLLSACAESQTYDLIIRNGRIADGSGEASYLGDVAINADTIAAIGNLAKAKSANEIDATGLTIAPGFINMLSWANESLIEDGRSQGDIRQGVTVEVLGEGHSMGPLNEVMKEEMEQDQGLMATVPSQAARSINRPTLWPSMKEKTYRIRHYW